MKNDVWRARAHKHAHTCSNMQKYTHLCTNAHTHTYIRHFINDFSGCFTSLKAYRYENLNFFSQDNGASSMRME